MKNYLIMFERVDKLSAKNIYLRNIGFDLEGIWATNLDYIRFYWILKGNLLDNDL